MRYFIFLGILFFWSFDNPTCSAEMSFEFSKTAFKNVISTNEICPVERVRPPNKKAKKIKKVKKNKTRNISIFQPKIKFTKRENQAAPNDVVLSLFFTFFLLALLPLFVIVGIFLLGFGFPILLFFIIGFALILLGNITALTAGAVAGSSKVYTTRVLSFFLWLFFGINLSGAIALLILMLSIFGGFALILIPIIALFVFALIAIIWALIIRKQNRHLRNNSEYKEEIF